MKTDMDKEITLSQLQQEIDRWIKGTGAGYFSPLTNTAMLAEETGEVAAVIARIYGDQRPKPGDSLNLEEEIADLLWVLTAIANQTGTDLTEAIRKNFLKKQTRDSKRYM